jgi:hypothetical protein
MLCHKKKSLVHFFGNGILFADIIDYKPYTTNKGRYTHKQSHQIIHELVPGVKVHQESKIIVISMAEKEVFTAAKVLRSP